MTEAPVRPGPDINLMGPGPAFIGGTLIFYYGDDFVEVSTIPDGDLAACAPDRFVPPGGQWDAALGKLETFSAVIVRGEPGSGRRTAALRLLADIRPAGPLYELTPMWKRPSIKVLQPASPGARYLLDMSEPTAEPARADFGSGLRAWARESHAYLVVTTTDEAGGRRWAGSAGDAVVQLRSPRARALAESELRTAGAEERITVLSDPAIMGILDSAPKAEDVCRLARLVIEGIGRAPQEIADEYRNWRDWIDKELPLKTLGSRALMWSAAFCDGGQRKSVLQMSEDLRRMVGENRTPVDILRDTPASQRLIDAEIKRDGDRASLSPARHGLAPALRAYLWDEFEDPALREILTNWVVRQLGTLPLEDADRVANGLLDIVISYRDDSLLRALRDQLTGKRRPLAVRALSKAALDPRFGAHVRASLYDWVTTSKSQDVIDLVAEVCGGIFGEQKPGMALVRLGWAAQKSKPGSPALASALMDLAAIHPEDVLRSISKWFSDSDPPMAGINAFLALASRAQGAALLCRRAEPTSGDSVFRGELIGYFRRSLAEPASHEVAISVLKAWEEFSAEGQIDSGTAISVLGVALVPVLRNHVTTRLHPGSWDLDSFWGRAFSLAIRTGETGASVPTE
jgi:hypothetical protein